MMLDDRPLVSRFAMELATSLLVFCLGAAVVVGALEYRIGWDDGGPQPGYFPFYVGLVIMAGALGTAIQAWRQRQPGAAPFATREQAWRVLSFFGPVLVFVLLCNLVGLYVAMAAYLVFTTRFQGGYGWARSLAIGVGTAVAFFVLFELLFGQPLLKGPLEAWLGFE